MKDLRFSELIDLYGSMLTQKQRDMAEQYYHMDYSLAEIAENEGVSRQAVHASLRQTQHALTELEQKLGFYRKTQAIQSELTRSKDATDTAVLTATLERIETLL